MIVLDRIPLTNHPTNMIYGYVDYTCDTHEPAYVGIGHLRRVKVKKRNCKHAAMSAKHGFVRIIEFSSTDVVLAIAWEIKTIAEYHTFIYDPLASHVACNMTLGGEGSRGAKNPNSDETRKKKSEAQKRLWIKKKRAGFKMSDDARAKVSAAQVGKPKSQEHRQKLSESVKRTLAKKS